MTSEELRAIATKRAYARLGFYIHLSVYVVVITVLGIINSAFTPDFPWIAFPAMHWGIGLFIHGIVALAVVGASLKERLIQAEIDRLASD